MIPVFLQLLQIIYENMHINMNAVDTNPYKYAVCTGSYLNNMKVHKHKFLTSIPNEVIALLSDCSIRVYAGNFQMKISSPIMILIFQIQYEAQDSINYESRLIRNMYGGNLQQVFIMNTPSNA